MMSAIASFELLPKALIEQLKAAAVPAKGGWLKKPTDNFHDFLTAHAREVVDYRWSGWSFTALLSYLDEKRGIDLAKSSYDELTTFLTNVRGSAYFVLTSEHRRDYLTRLNVEDYNADELSAYNQDFNGSEEENAGQPMLDGIKALNDALSQVDDDTIILFGIG
jgi:hypothetical protein